MVILRFRKIVLHSKIITNDKKRHRFGEKLSHKSSRKICLGLNPKELELFDEALIMN